MNVTQLEKNRYGGVFPRLQSVTRFPALATSCKFSRACHQLQFFPALVTNYKFSRVCQHYDFPALATGCKFLRILIGF
ncbi:hypothetical protein ACROYT_G043617 [Oculina patagonica]